jgi:hypothetical protein
VSKCHKTAIGLYDKPKRMKKVSVTFSTCFLGILLVSGMSTASEAATSGSPIQASVTNSVKHSSSVSFVPTTANGCQGQELAIAVGSGNGAAGTAFLPVIFTNYSTNTCWLKGYPSVSFSNSAFDVDNNAVHVRSGVYANPKPQLIVLRPSQVASIGISYTDISVRASVCHTFRTVNVSWRADNLLWKIHIPHMNYPCGNRFAVTPFEKGALPENS